MNNTNLNGSVEKIGPFLKKPELLAPAGSFSGMKAAVNAGADAVYMGGTRFGARAYADNPDTEGMIRAIEFCHLRGRKLYLTVNTLLKEHELEEEMFEYLSPLYEAGLDAVIVQDVGVMEYIGRNFPGLDIHVSTQCSITMAEGIEAIKGLVSNPESITRVVPARELSLPELKEMREKTGVKMEVFIHGALCFCYSGQCLLSSLAGGRSGNRGRCAQPCRRLYEVMSGGEVRNGYYLSPKDMCTLDMLGSLIDLGIDSFKIEGRMKSEEYAAGVVSVYREFIDRYCGSAGKEKEYDTDAGRTFLSEIYNRGGFNEGYLHTHNGQEMMSTSRPGHFGVPVGKVYKTEGRKAFIRNEIPLNKGDVLEIRDENGKKTVYEFTVGENYTEGSEFSILTMKDRLPARGQGVFRTKNGMLLESLREKYIERDSKVPVDMEITARRGSELKIKMSTQTAKGICEAEVTGNIVQEAIKAASTPENLKEQAGKLGETDFTVNSIHADSDPDVFVQVGELKRLRRECALELTKKILSLNLRTLVEKKTSGIQKNDKNTGNPCCVISVRTMEQLEEVLKKDTFTAVTDIYMDLSDFGVCGEAKAGDKSSGLTQKVLSLAENTGINLYFKLPRILRSTYYAEIKDFCERYKEKAGFIAENYEELFILKTLGAHYRTDHNLYCFNSRAGGMYKTGRTLPVELNEEELKTVADSESELIVYGLLPVMVSAQCAYKTVTGKCGMHDDMVLKDEKGFSFRAHSVCRYCYSVIGNSAVQCLFHRWENVKNIGCGRVRVELTYENAAETALVLRSMERIFDGQKDEFPTEIMGYKLTNGHFNRGVE
ncbi:MAG: U32 family peptidase [Lachnospiraceae bacterium]|nr:U32 family peptidase [Lachnospiraceae bacterium]